LTVPPPHGPLLERVDTLADALGIAHGPPMTRLVQVAAAVREGPWSTARSHSWLALAVLSGTFPTGDEVTATARAVRRAPRDDAAALALLTEALGAVTRTPVVPAAVEVVTGAVLVDVHHTAGSDLMTGVQRVVRTTARHWDRAHDCRFVRWRLPDRGALLDLSARGRGRLGLEPDDTDADATGPGRDDDSASGTTALPATETGTPADGRTVLVPWRSRLLLLESGASGAVERLSAFGEHSDNVLGLVGYDTIPVSSADTVTVEEAERFAVYLSVVKHADVVAGISRSAAEEFAGFVSGLGAQGLPGPRVVAVPLPVPAPAAAPTDGPAAEVALDAPAVPVVLVVGSHEPRKNHVAVLHAAERLWREGRRFRLRFIGGSGWMSDDFDATVARLLGEGRDLVVERAVSDDVLDRAYQEAAFTVFPSLHEGFGLPVAESLAHGRPVVTSRYGATAEAAGGRATLVDPRDDDDLLEAVRTLLDGAPQADGTPRTDGTVVDTGAAQDVRTWEQYAERLWDDLVGGTA
jgi:glycosyltransferase involved in cell wall biosynthesis